MNLKHYLAAFALAALALTGNPRLHAQAIIGSGNVLIGVQTWGNLNVPDAAYANADGTQGVGLRSTSTGHESTFDGCPCEGWGAAVVGGANDGAWGGANQNYYGGAVNLTNTVFTSTPTTATSTTEIANVMRITHEFTPTATPYLYSVTVTLTNLSGGVLGAGPNGIRYTRVMDWDIDPTPFAELVTLHGNGASNLLGTTDDGFSDPNPLNNNSDPTICTGNPANTDFVDVGPCDHGGRFDFGFSALGVGQSRSFQIFYGVAPTEQDMFTALATVGADNVYSFGQASNTDFCRDPAGGPGNPTCETFAFAFGGVGGTPVVATPEPASVALLATGLIGIGGIARRRRAA